MYPLEWLTLCNLSCRARFLAFQDRVLRQQMRRCVVLDLTTGPSPRTSCPEGRAPAHRLHRAWTDGARIAAALRTGI